MNYMDTIIVGVGIPKRMGDSSNQHFRVDIVMIAKTEGFAPLLFRLNQSAIKDDILVTTREQVHIPQGGVVLMGQVVSHQKEKKMILMCDQNDVSRTFTVEYKHLIIASHSRGYLLKDGENDEFSIGLDNLVKALKIEKNMQDRFTSRPYAPEERELLFKLLQKSKTIKTDQNQIEKLALDCIKTKWKDGNPNLLNIEKRLFEVQL